MHRKTIPLLVAATFKSSRISIMALGISAGAVLMPGTARAANFQLADLSEDVEYAQTSTAAPVTPSTTLSGQTSPFDFSAAVIASLGQSISVSSATLTGGPYSLEDTLTLFPQGGLSVDDFQSSLSALEGYDGTYSLQVNTVHDGTKAFNGLSLSGDNFPGASYITNWSALQSANVNQPITVDYTPSNIGVGALAVLGVWALGNGPDVFESPLPGQPGVLTGASTSVTIPAGTLLADETYTVRLSVLNPVEVDTSTYPGAWAGSVYVSETDFNIRTVSGLANLTWNNIGGASPSDGKSWDISTNSNWNNGTAATVYTDGSNVTFSDSNNGNSAVTLNTTVNPASVTVNNSDGNYTISGTGKIVDAGALVKTGTGTLTIGTALSVGSLSITGGTLKLAANTTLGSGTATSNVILTSLTVSGTGVLDVNNNHIIITYGASDPVSTIAGYLETGYNGGNWNGLGGIDTSAPLTVNGLKYGLGFADGKDGKVVGLSSGEIEVGYTLLGDANLDGFVNGEDFAILASNFNQSVTGWDRGDFNYDGTVNGEDFLDLASNFNQGVSGAASAGDVAALDAFAAANGLALPTSSVPEPASASIVVAASVGFLAARRARRRATE
jgi:hypothetical protein